MSVFRLCPVTESNLAECAALIGAHEKSCASFAALFAKNGVLSLPANSAFFYAVYCVDSDCLCAVFMFDENSSLILHCIPQFFLSEEESRRAFCRAASPAFKKGEPYCIMGESFGTELLLEALNRACRTNREYELFEYLSGGENAPVLMQTSLQAPPGLYVRRCTPFDAAVLYPLQRSYEIEEVLPPGDSHSRLLCMSGLKKTLANQQVYALFDSAGMPVAKAGTNAQAFAWSQIGGVYTVPEWRGRGLARFLVSFIARELTDAGKHAVLFVKTANIPAKRAYLNAGFVPAGNYRIIYF